MLSKQDIENGYWYDKTRTAELYETYDVDFETMDTIAGLKDKPYTEQKIHYGPPVPLTRY